MDQLSQTSTDLWSVNHSGWAMMGQFTRLTGSWKCAPKNDYFMTLAEKKEFIEEIRRLGVNMEPAYLVDCLRSMFAKITKVVRQ